MAQAALPKYPDHEFSQWNKKETLFIEGHKLSYNKKHVKNDGITTHYFYCCNRAHFGCKKSARALKGEDGTYSLIGYSGLHSNECIPNKAYLAVRKVKTAIKSRIMDDPTLKPSEVYNSEVNRVRDALGESVINKFIINIH